MKNKKGWHSILLIGLVVLLASPMVACGEQVPPSSPTIGLNLSSLSFSAEEGGANPASKTLSISNSGGATLDWWVSDDADWLSLSPTSGTNTGEIEEVTVSVDIMDMNAGNYTANSAISASGASNNPQTIIVDLSIVEIPPETLSVHFIDVGQGDAILIDHGTYEMLIDGGRWGDCADYIPSYVDGVLEVMVATHPDADHIGGLSNVLDAFDVKDIWVNGDTASTQTYIDFMAKVNAEGAEVHQAQRGDQISLSTLTFDVLHPTLPLGSDINENSIVLGLSFGQVDFLFTGDVENGAEASMVAAGLIDDIDILKVAHHGSKYSSTASFLNASQPEIAIYSAGANNSYGHPAPETITRLCDIGATIYGTDVHGTILVTTNGTTYNVHPSNAVPPVVCSITHNLTISSTSGGNVTTPGEGTFGPYDHGTVVNLTATPDANYTFINWTTANMSEIANATAASTTVTVDENKTVTANFAEVTTATLEGHVSYLSRGTNNSRWAQPFLVRAFEPGNLTNELWNGTATTNNTGVFTMSGLTPGTYDIGIKNWTALSELATSVTLSAGNTTVVNFGTTREGDSNGDDVVVILDFSLLAGAFLTTPASPNWNANCDFDRNGAVVIVDFSLLAGNFLQAGPLQGY